MTTTTKWAIRCCPFETLHLACDAPTASIVRAWHVAMREVHPDKAGGANTELAQGLNEAKEDALILARDNPCPDARLVFEASERICKRQRDAYMQTRDAGGSVPTPMQSKEAEELLNVLIRVQKDKERRAKAEALAKQRREAEAAAKQKQREAAVRAKEAERERALKQEEEANNKAKKQLREAEEAEREQARKRKAEERQEAAARTLQRHKAEEAAKKEARAAFKSALAEARVADLREAEARAAERRRERRAAVKSARAEAHVAYARSVEENATARALKRRALGANLPPAVEAQTRRWNEWVEEIIVPDGWTLPTSLRAAAEADAPAVVVEPV